MFTRNFAFDMVTRVWDIFLHEDIKIVYRTSLGLVKYLETDILQSSFENIMDCIRNVHTRVDVERLMAIVWSIALHRCPLLILHLPYQPPCLKSSLLYLGKLYRDKIKEFEDSFNKQQQEKEAAKSKK